MPTNSNENSNSQCNLQKKVVFLSNDGPFDTRQVCNTIDDFQVSADNGIELRYEGLITFEKATGKLKICKKNDSTWIWEEISIGSLLTEINEIKLQLAQKTTLEDVQKNLLGGYKYVFLTQSQYESLPVKEKNIVYMIMNSTI